MKQLLKLSILLCLSPLAFCACDKNDGDDDRGCVYPHPSQPSESIYNYTGEVEFVVDAPQIKEKIEQDLTENPPFGGAKKVSNSCEKSFFSSCCNVYIKCGGHQG